jgi:hypothetical protein
MDVNGHFQQLIRDPSHDMLPNRERGKPGRLSFQGLFFPLLPFIWNFQDGRADLMQNEKNRPRLLQFG